ncbi:MAG: PD-(D/E)XK motif protein [Thermoleophilaceae bacterium]
MSSAALEALWDGLDPPPAGTLTGQPPAGTPAPGVRLAIDHAKLRHLLLPTTAADTLPERPLTRGLEVSIDELRVGQETPRHFFDVSCRDPTQNRTFAKVCEEILDEIAADPGHPRAVLARVLDRWRHFWAAPPGRSGTRKSSGSSASCGSSSTGSDRSARRVSPLARTVSGPPRLQVPHRLG